MAELDEPDWLKFVDTSDLVIDLTNGSSPSPPRSPGVRSIAGGMPPPVSQRRRYPAEPEEVAYFQQTAPPLPQDVRMSLSTPGQYQQRRAQQSVGSFPTESNVVGTQQAWQGRDPGVRHLLQMTSQRPLPAASQYAFPQYHNTSAKRPALDVMPSTPSPTKRVNTGSHIMPMNPASYRRDSFTWNSSAANETFLPLDRTQWASSPLNPAYSMAPQIPELRKTVPFSFRRSNSRPVSPPRLAPHRYHSGYTPRQTQTVAHQVAHNERPRVPVARPRYETPRQFPVPAPPQIKRYSPPHPPYQCGYKTCNVCGTPPPQQADWQALADHNRAVYQAGAGGALRTHVEFRWIRETDGTLARVELADLQLARLLRAEIDRMDRMGAQRKTCMKSSSQGSMDSTSLGQSTNEQLNEELRLVAVRGVDEAQARGEVWAFNTGKKGIDNYSWRPRDDGSIFKRARK